jgi:hypothetical protein
MKQAVCEKLSEGPKIGVSSNKRLKEQDLLLQQHWSWK